ncbi:hypothetical protein B0H14DRAFT_2928680 [Mycena olivaceomarginata]|nr:hypothetical protein B0H14DRAFT_2928680 [Mycena olivaceomarginata]
MSQALSAEILAFRGETKELKYQRCGACQKPAYCSLPAKGTDERNTLSDIKKWFAKHTQLLAYAATHAMKLHDLANLSMITTHMLAVELEPAPSGKNADFVYGLTAPARAGLAASAAGLAPGRYRLTIYVRSGVAGYLAPISVELGTALQHVARFGPPDNDWNGFLERAINKTLGDKDKTRSRGCSSLM